MVLKAFWGSLGLLLGALGALLGVSWELLRASGSTKEGLQIRLGTLLGLVCSLLAAESGLGRVLGPSLVRFWCTREPFGVCFGLRQIDFSEGIIGHGCRCLGTQGIRSRTRRVPAVMRWNVNTTYRPAGRTFSAAWQLCLRE